MARARKQRNDQTYEKSVESVKMLCTPSEKAAWTRFFGRGKVSETARALMNRRLEKLKSIRYTPE